VSGVESELLSSKPLDCHVDGVKDYCMENYQIVRENWKRIFCNRVLWIFGLFAITSEIYPKSTAQSEYLSLRCAGIFVSIFVIAISAIGRVGLIYISNDISQAETLSFKQVWRRSVKSFPRVFLMELIMGFFMLAPSMLIAFTTSVSDIHQNVAYSIIPWAISVVIYIITTLSACGIVIHKLGIAHSIVVGIRILIQRTGALILLGATYVIVPMFIAYGCLFLLTYYYDPNLLSQITVSMLTYSQIVKFRLIAVIWVLIYLFIIPLNTVLITQIYKATITKRDLKSGCIMAI